MITSGQIAERMQKVLDGSQPLSYYPTVRYLDSTDAAKVYTASSLQDKL